MPTLPSKDVTASMAKLIKVGNADESFPPGVVILSLEEGERDIA